MKLEEVILLKNCPNWLKIKGIEVKNEDIEIIDGIVHWNSGTWVKGIWKYGIWHDGTWYKGIWKGGQWRGGTWCDGTWEEGDWKDGTWKNGDWKDGTWVGGTWMNGIWHNGTWKFGIWYNGVKLKVKYVFSTNCKWKITYSDTEINIGCTSKTIDEWVTWLDTDEVFETPRDSEQFIPIRNAILTIKFLTDLEKGK